MFKQFIEDAKEYFYDDPVALVGTLLISFGLLGVIALGVFLVASTVGIYIAMGGLCFVMMMLGGILMEL